MGGAAVSRSTIRIHLKKNGLYGSGTKSFGVMRPKLNFVKKGVNKANDESLPFLL